MRCLYWVVVLMLIPRPVWAIDNERLAHAIYHAENSMTHPYGIMIKCKDPKQVCLNTISHAKRDFKGGDFIKFLGDRYCPIGASNDPKGLNKNWVRNVKLLYTKGN